MQLPNTHQNLLQQTAELANELTEIEKSLQQKEDSLFTHIESINHELNQVSQQKYPEPIKQILANNLTDAQSLLNAWQEKVEQHKANLSFRKGFGDSLLLYVYGKVKSGKSSLGNYLVSGTSNPSPELLEQLAQAGHQPKYFLHDKNKDFEEAINHSKGFAVGELETTSCIQGFSLPGLTWVDSPGLHSVEKDNGELAEKYISSADLVIYLMHSNHAGRNTDMQELASLLQANKRILVLLTQCDEQEQDEDASGKVIYRTQMFSAEDRQKIENYTKEQLADLCQSSNYPDADISVLSLSVGYAEEQQNNPAGLKESGVLAVFEQLEELLKSEGIELKKQVPRHNLLAFYSSLVDVTSDISIIHLNRPLKTALDMIENQRKEIKLLTEYSREALLADYVKQIDLIVDKYAASQDIPAIQKAVSKFIQQEIITKYQEPLSQRLDQSFNALNSAISNDSIHGLEFKERYREVEIDVSAKRKAKGSIWGAVLGGAIGFLVAGPVGLAIGTSAASPLGSYIAGQSGKTKTVKVAAGDNREDIKYQFYTYGTQLINEQYDYIANQVNQEILNPLTQTLRRLNNNLIQLEHYINNEIKLEKAQLK